VEINKENRVVYIVAGVFLAIIVTGIIAYATGGTDEQQKKRAVDISEESTVNITKKLDDIITIQVEMIDSLRAVRNDINTSNEQARRDIANQTKRQRDEIDRIRNYNPALDVLIDDYNRAIHTEYPFD
jgi:hypothetical protein